MPGFTCTFGLYCPSSGDQLHDRIHELQVHFLTKQNGGHSILTKLFKFLTGFTIGRNFQNIHNVQIRLQLESGAGSHFLPNFM